MEPRGLPASAASGMGCSGLVLEAIASLSGATSGATFFRKL
jgi:hypothetical protein